MRARGAAKKVAVRRDDENAAPTIEGDEADRNETSKVNEKPAAAPGDGAQSVQLENAMPVNEKPAAAPGDGAQSVQLENAMPAGDMPLLDSASQDKLASLQQAGDMPHLESASQDKLAPLQQNGPKLDGTLDRDLPGLGAEPEPKGVKDPSVRSDKIQIALSIYHSILAQGEKEETERLEQEEKREKVTAPALRLVQQPSSLLEELGVDSIKGDVLIAPTQVPYTEQARLPPWTMRDVRWPMATYIVVCHLLALVGIFMIPSCKTATILWATALWPIGAFGITGGAHRLWAHRSYRASFAFRAVLMLCNSIANQGTIYHWARDHRTHHFHSETCADPHDAGRGFFYAHMGWLFLKKDPRVTEAGRKINMDDLKADSLVMFQLRTDPWWNSTWAFIFPAFVARVAWGESLLLGVLVLGFVRYVWLLHCTWCVNSVAHLWGERPYDETINPAENMVVSVLAIGEGWHNWHHKYPFDYAASEFGASSQFNPTKLAIDMGAALGMVSDRKRATAMWVREKVKREMVASKVKDQ